MISSRHLRYRYQIFQNFKPVAMVAVPVDERKKLGGGSEQYPLVGEQRPVCVIPNLDSIVLRSQLVLLLLLTQGTNERPLRIKMFRRS
jgi:hypothetical protein